MRILEDRQLIQVVAGVVQQRGTSRGAIIAWPTAIDPCARVWDNKPLLSVNIGLRSDRQPMPPFVKLMPELKVGVPAFVRRAPERRMVL
jgi:hypothetical protein